MDFAGLMRAALMPQAMGGLGLSPQVFWGLTPQELRLMLGREEGGAMSSARLAALLEKYPDTKKGA